MIKYTIDYEFYQIMRFMLPKSGDKFMNEIKKTIKAVIFDLDGTILNTHDQWHNATKAVLAKRGFVTLTPEQEEVLLSLSGVTIRNAARVLYDKFHITDPIEEFVVEKKDTFIELFKQSDASFIHGFESFVQKLRHHEIPHSIATNADDHSLAAMSKRACLESFFGNHIYNITHVQNRAKPDPAIFLHAADKLGFAPSECIVFEDSLQGFLAAEAAKIRCIAIKNEHNASLLNKVHGAIDSYDEAEEVMRLIAKTMH